MTLSPALIGGLLFVLQGAQSPAIRIDSREQGRTFFVDPDRPEIRKALRDVSAPSPAGPMPEWVTPPPDATPWGQRGENTPVDFGVATYTSTTPPDPLFAYFESRARAAGGVTITSITRQPGRGGAFHAEDSGRNVVVSVSPGVRAVADFSINWRPKVISPVVIPRSSRLFAVWYDDTKQVLRLRDSTTLKEYELGMATMLRYARSVALEPSARSDFPPWLAFYPGANVIAAFAPPPGWRPQTGADMRSFNIELTTTRSGRRGRRVLPSGVHEQRPHHPYGVAVAGAIAIPRGTLVGPDAQSDHQHPTENARYARPTHGPLHAAAALTGARGSGGSCV